MLNIFIELGLTLEVRLAGRTRGGGLETRLRMPRMLGGGKHCLHVLLSAPCVKVSVHVRELSDGKTIHSPALWSHLQP